MVNITLLPSCPQLNINYMHEKGDESTLETKKKYTVKYRKEKAKEMVIGIKDLIHTKAY